MENLKFKPDENTEHSRIFDIFFIKDDERAYGPFQESTAKSIFIYFSAIGILYFGISLFAGINIYYCLPLLIMPAFCASIFAFGKTTDYERLLIMSSAFLYFPYLFLISGGINGPVFMFMVFNCFLTGLLFAEKSVVGILIILQIMVSIGLIVLQVYLPDIFKVYQNSEMYIVSMLLGIAITFAAAGFLTASVVKKFIDEHKSDMEYNARLERISTRDSLTGLYNRRHIEECVNRELDEMERREEFSAYFLMIDIDNFKGVNDTFGHAAGDLTLFQISKAMINCLRSVDILGRFGGDEFCVFLPDASHEIAAIICERIRSSIEKIRIRQYEEVRVTSSIGAVSCKTGDRFNTVFERADNKLYEAKKAGRNCTVMGD